MLFPYAGLELPDAIRCTFRSDVDTAGLAYDLHDKDTLRLMRPMLHMGATLVINRVSRLVVDPTRGEGMPFSGESEDPVPPAVYEVDPRGLPLRVDGFDEGREDVQRLVKHYFDPWHRTIKDIVKRCLERHRRCWVLDVRGFHGRKTEFIDKPDKGLPAVCLGTIGMHTPGAWLDWFRDLLDESHKFSPAERLFAVDDPFPAFRMCDSWQTDDPHVSAMVLNVMRETLTDGIRPRDSSIDPLGLTLRRFGRYIADTVAAEVDVERRPIPSEEAVTIVQQWLRDHGVSAPIEVEKVMDGERGRFTVRDSYRGPGFINYWDIKGLRGHWIVNVDDDIRFVGKTPGRVSFLVEKWTGEVRRISKVV